MAAGFSALKAAAVQATREAARKSQIDDLARSIYVELVADQRHEFDRDVIETLARQAREAAEIYYSR